MPAKPKPTKQKRLKKKKAITSICVQCGYLWHGGAEFEEHDPECTRELPVIVKNSRKTERQMVSEALDHVCRELTKWRDGVRCVIHGDACGRYSEWGHVIPQGSCSYLVYELSNSFRQSEACNLKHRFVQLDYFDWYRHKWGNTAMQMLKDAWHNAPKGGLSTQELVELLAHHVELYDSRHIYTIATLEEKVAAGFYGDIIYNAWAKDGRI